MSTTMSFKVTCESCEARILIKDHSMIGRKIDCPKCRYKFVVPPPESAQEEEKSVDQAPAAAKAGSEEKQTNTGKPATVEAKPTGKKVAPGKPVLDKLVATLKPSLLLVEMGPGANTKKATATPLTPEEQAEEEELVKEPPKPEPAKIEPKLGKWQAFKLRIHLSLQKLLAAFQNKSNTLKIGIALGVVAVIALVGGLIAMLSGGGGDPNSNQMSGPPKTPVARGPSSSKISSISSADSVKVNTLEDDLTGWVPNDADMTLAIQVFGHHLEGDQPLENALFKTTGGFTRSWVEAKLGIKLADLQRVVRSEGGPPDHRWTVTFLKMDKKIDADQLVEKIGSGAKKEKTPKFGFSYYMFQPNEFVDGLGQLMLGKAGLSPQVVAARPQGSALAFFLMRDKKTAMIGDRDRLVKLLEDGRPKPANAGSTPTSSAASGTHKSSSQSASSANSSGKTVTSSAREVQSGSATSSKAPSSAVASPSSDIPAVEADLPPAEPYSALPRSLRDMVERMKAEGRDRVLLTAVSNSVDYELLRRIDHILNTDLVGVCPPQPEKAGLRHVGVVVYKLESNGIAFAFAMDFADPDKAFQVHDAFQKIYKPNLEKRIWDQLLVSFVESNRPPSLRSKVSSGPASDRGSGLRAPKSSSSSSSSKSSVLHPPPPPPPPPKNEPVGSITVDLEDTTVIVNATMSWPEATGSAPSIQTYHLLEFLRSSVLHSKGVLEMMGTRDSLEELSQAVRNYIKAKQAEPKAEDRKFPRGALARKIPTERGDMPWPVRQRLSWMVELLPYLPNSDIPLFLKTEVGQKEFKERYTVSPTNGMWSPLSHMLVPEFLVERRTAENAWWIEQVLRNPLGATHVVGVGGVGLDIAHETDMSNPKVGIFGFERETRFDLIKGKEDRIILMIQIPVYLPPGLYRKEFGPVYPTPWMIGGGTVRGIPETNSLDPFLCTERDGKIGTHVIMADGTVRFLAKGAITDQEFQALCTIQGAKPSLEVLDRIAPRVSK